MKKTEVAEVYLHALNEITQTTFTFEGVEYDLLIIDSAGMEGGCGYQIRDTYLSLKNKDNYMQASHGDGYNGYKSLLNNPALLNEMNEVVHLNSDSWELLKKYEMELKEL